MTAPTATHYLNSDFDLSLRPRPRQLAHATLQRQACELTALALLGADPGDAVLVRVDISESFLDYLTGCGLPRPRVALHPDSDRSSVLRPLGWNAETIELNGRHDRPVEHPSLECIQAVNARSFALSLERKLFPEAAAGTSVSSRADLQHFLNLAEPGREWILKSEYGNAGLGNRRLRSTALTDDDRRFVDQRFTEEDRLLIEPYRHRVSDWAMVFDVPFEPDSLRAYETVCTKDGALIGAVFDPPGPHAGPQADALTAAAAAIAEELTAAGYFGPVCVDGFSYGSASAPEVRLLVDLNCRRSINDGVYRLWRRLAPERAVYFRFFASRKLDFPAAHPEAVLALGDAAYDPTKRSGILLGTPSGCMGPGERRRPLKLALLFFAADRASALALERRFRRRFERRS